MRELLFFENLESLNSWFIFILQNAIFRMHNAFCEGWFRSLIFHLSNFEEIHFIFFAFIEKIYQLLHSMQNKSWRRNAQEESI